MGLNAAVSAATAEAPGARRRSEGTRRSARAPDDADRADAPGGFLTPRAQASRMYVDLGNALSSVASPGVSRESLERLDEDVAAAHERIERGRANDEHGYAALNLPETADP